VMLITLSGDITLGELMLETGAGLRLQNPKEVTANFYAVPLQWRTSSTSETDSGVMSSDGPGAHPLR